MHHLSVKIRGGLAAAVLAALAGGWAVPAPAQTPGLAPAAPAEKKYKDQGEYDIYNEVTKDMLANSFAKAVTDLDAWKQKYPGSDFKDDRSVLYVQVYAGSNQFAKAVDEAGLLIAKGLKTVLNDPKNGPSQQLKVLYTAAAAITQVPTPTADELAIGAQAAQQLLDYNTKPEGASDAAWAAARATLQTAAKGALLYIAMKPGVDALQVAGPAAAAAIQASKQQPPDAALVAKNRAAADAAYGAAEAAFLAALQQYPDSSQIAYQLGASELGQQATYPAKISLALYEIARAVSVDPAKSDFAGPDARTKADDYLKRVYVRYHGADDGLDQLKQQAAAAPVPPADFHILSASEVIAKQQEAFAKQYPDLALWMNIKAQLIDANGQQYFETQLKDAQVPKLKGILVDAKPACHSKELLVAVPLPDAKPPFAAEIALKLDTPLTGKADENVELVWNDGQPSAFSRDPFLLTIDVEKAKISGLKVTNCAPPPVVHHPVVRKKS
jgi:hypothetical protein